jgi:hypothetical protein
MADDRSNASRTPLSNFGVSLQPGLLSAQMGLASNLGMIARGPHFARVLNNLHMLTRGVWTSRGIGWARERAGSFNAGGEFKDFGFFIDNAGVRTLLFQAGDKLYSYNLTTHTETQILTGLSLTDLPCIRRSYSPTTGNSVVIYCNGNIEPQKITSVSTSVALGFTNSGGATTWGAAANFNGKSYSKPKFCSPFGDRFVYSGFKNANTAFDVLITAQGDPESFVTTVPQKVTDAVAFTYPPELGQLKSVQSYRLTNQTNDEVMIFGCTDGVFIITGSNASTFSLKILTREYGIPSNRAFAQVGNDLLFLSTKGIRSFSSLTDNAVLGSSSLSFPIHDLINLIDTANWEKAHAVHNRNTQEVMFWVPLQNDAGACKHAFVLNYNNDESAGGSVVPIWSTRDGTSVACSINFADVVYGGGYDGLLQKWYSGDKYDTGAITFQITTALANVGNPSQKASMKQVDVLADGGDQQFTMRANIYQKMSGGNFRKIAAAPPSVQLSSASPAATALGSWTLGFSAFPSNHVKVLTWNPAGNGQFWEFEIVSTGSTDALDYSGLAYTLSGGGVER